MCRSAIVAFLLCVPAFSFAAFLPSIDTQLEIAAMPEYPEPGQTVVLTVHDTQENEGSTAYIWSVNKKVVAQGIGMTSVSLLADSIGTAETVSVIAVENGEARGEGTLVLRPSSLDIIWEGNTEVPLFYEGRPLPSGQSSVTLLALPHVSLGGGEADPNTLVYEWRINGVIAKKQSGYGKSSAVIVPPQFGTAFTIDVSAATRNGAAVAKNSVRIDPRVPTVVLYENAPLLGVRFDRVVKGAFALTGDEVSFIAYPLFTSRGDTLQYSWSLDGVPFEVDASKPRAATFRKVGTGTGSHAVSFLFKNSKKFTEEGSRSFQLTF